MIAHELSSMESAESYKFDVAHSAP